jgi:hypothetical protein
VQIYDKIGLYAMILQILKKIFFKKQVLGIFAERLADNKKTSIFAPSKKHQS